MSIRSKRLLSIAAVLSLSVPWSPIQGVARAESVVFADTFDAEPTGQQISTLADWTVTGNVDVVPLFGGTFDPYPGNGNYLDLDGSNSCTSATIATAPINLAPGVYRLSFEVGNNTFPSGDPDANGLHVQLGTLLDETIQPSPVDYDSGTTELELTPFSYLVTVTETTLATLSFQETDATPDCGGTMLDDVSLELVTDETPPVITITTPPDDASFELGSTILADYGCDDGEGSGVASCTGTVANGAAIDTSTIGNKIFTVDAVDEANNVSSLTHGYNVVYDFGGLLAPVNELPTLNRTKAGGAIPVKFSLGGDQGLAIFATGFPKSQGIACESAAPVDGIEEIVTAGHSGLSYDPSSDRYTYVWKTAKAWSGTCRQLVLGFVDGTSYRANFELR